MASTISWMMMCFGFTSLALLSSAKADMPWQWHCVDSDGFEVVVRFFGKVTDPNLRPQGVDFHYPEGNLSTLAASLNPTQLQSDFSISTLIKTPYTETPGAVHFGLIFDSTIFGPATHILPVVPGLPNQPVDAVKGVLTVSNLTRIADGSAISDRNAVPVVCYETNDGAGG